MTKPQTVSQIKQVLNQNFPPGKEFKAYEVQEYLDVRTPVIGRYLSQMPNVKVVRTERSTHGHRGIRTYMVIA